MLVNLPPLFRLEESDAIFGILLRLGVFQLFKCLLYLLLHQIAKGYAQQCFRQFPYVSQLFLSQLGFLFDLRPANCIVTLAHNLPKFGSQRNGYVQQNLQFSFPLKLHITQQLIQKQPFALIFEIAFILPRQDPPQLLGSRHSSLAKSVAHMNFSERIEDTPIQLLLHAKIKFFQQLADLKIAEPNVNAVFEPVTRRRVFGRVLVVISEGGQRRFGGRKHRLFELYDSINQTKQCKSGNNPAKIIKHRWRQINKYQSIQLVSCSTGQPSNFVIFRYKMPPISYVLPFSAQPVGFFSDLFAFSLQDFSSFSCRRWPESLSPSSLKKSVKTFYILIASFRLRQLVLRVVGGV